MFLWQPPPSEKFHVVSWNLAVIEKCSITVRFDSLPAQWLTLFCIPHFLPFADSEFFIRGGGVADPQTIYNLGLILKIML
jgi:hypothetical protein